MQLVRSSSRLEVGRLAKMQTEYGTTVSGGDNRRASTSDLTNTDSR